MQVLFGVLDKFVPLEGGAGVGFVGLDMVVADEAAMGFELVVGEFCADEVVGGIFGVIEGEFGEDAAESGGEFGECFVLLRGEVVLEELLILDFAGDGFGTDGAGDEVRSADAGGVERNLDVGAGGIFFIPAVEGSVVTVGADVGDLNADGAGIRDGGVPGAFFEVEGLVNGAIQIEHEVDAEATMVVENFETLAAGAGSVVMEHELIDGVLQAEEIPTAAADFFAFDPGEGGVAQAVAIWGGEIFDLSGGIFPIGFIEGSKATFDAIGIVAAGVEPEDDGSASVEELAGGDDFIAGAGGVSAGGVRFRSGGAGGKQEQAKEWEEMEEIEKMFERLLLHGR